MGGRSPLERAAGRASSAGPSSVGSSPAGSSSVSWPSPTLWLPLLLALLVLLSAGWAPVVDEESYLDIAAQLAADPARPYDWFRPWQPWGAERPADAFLFAHPPLHLWWLSAWQRLTPMGPALRLAVGLPWALLLGWAVASMSLRSGAGQRGAWLWAASPVVVLGVQSSLMIDLPVLALSAAAVASWQRAAQGLRSDVAESNDGLSAAGLGAAGSSAEEPSAEEPSAEEPSAGGRAPGHRKWLLAAGVLLGLAASTKYPALVLLPVFALDASRRRVLKATAPLWLGFLATWGLIEAALAWQYGRIHVFYVLQTADQIARGPLSGRAAGLLARAGLLVSPPLALLLGVRAAALGGLSALVVAVLLQGQLETSGLLLTAGLAFCGGALISRALKPLVPPRSEPSSHPSDSASGSPASAPPASASLASASPASAPLASAPPASASPALAVPASSSSAIQEAPLLALWLLAALAAVLVGHNYVGGRYLLPASVPLALLLARATRGQPRAIFVSCIIASALLAAGLSRAEARYAAAADQLALDVHQAALDRGLKPGWFTGEWTFRWRMQSLGWRFYAGGALPSGALVARPANASPGLLPQSLRPLVALESEAQGGLRLIELEQGIGYHAETLGPQPIGVVDGPLERVELLRQP